MPKPLPKLSPPPEDQPDTRDPIEVALKQHLEDVREWTEWMTNGDPQGIGRMDYGIYRTFEEWVKKKEALDIIDGILQKRLTLGFPYTHKALILAQIIPSDRLAPYAKLVEPFLPPKPPSGPEDKVDIPKFFNPLIASIAQGIHTQATAEIAKQEAAKKAEEEKKKQDEEIERWELWCNLYGRSRADWYPHPGNPQWTYWGWSEIGKENWWKGRND
ncbi:hypothetical protein L486_03864 [Kwoniella mangroviensis CBS 10435]|uniref:Uncharacterized protein n=1 Tax=Kwoniella mangroviensis CBS 10435 TaxID=1331196 RepID=A0A1B9IUZ1_9TREE|nr:uncharacterized protein I203_08531 [Kwoniella mangroviensis CBS 8507]OCF59360.1 hypothetical protein L486_03864 [Kwoniella mangroviensis CBS 10435]OCF62394.1 hypothetical protein I203_08531 [Kwoniella mangroviensis CBS 8507]